MFYSQKMKYLPGVSYLVNFFKRKSIEDQLPFSYSANSQLLSPSGTVLDTSVEQSSPKKNQLLAEKQNQQQDPHSTVWQKVLKITKDNSVLEEHQPKNVKTERRGITPPLHATATATTKNVSIKFKKRLTCKRRNSFPQQFQMYQLHYRLDHENDDQYIDKEEMHQKLHADIPNVDYQSILIGSSMISDPSLGEESNTTESSNEEQFYSDNGLASSTISDPSPGEESNTTESSNDERFYSDNGLASSTISEPKKEESKGHDLYASNIWAPKDIEPEESWRLAFRFPKEQHDEENPQMLEQTQKQQNPQQQMRLPEQPKEQLENNFQHQQEQDLKESQQQQKELLDKSEQQQKQLQGHSQQYKLLQERFQQEQKKIQEQAQQHKVLEEKYLQEQKQLGQQQKQLQKELKRRKLHEELQQKQRQEQLQEQFQQKQLQEQRRQKQLQEQLQQQQRPPEIDFNGNIYYDHQQTAMQTNGGYGGLFSDPLLMNHQPAQIQNDYQQQFPLQSPHMPYINQERPQNQLFPHVQHPNRYQHVQHPNMYQPVRHPDMYQHIQQPNMYQHAQQLDMYQHVQQNFVEQPDQYQTLTPVEQYGFLPHNLHRPLLPQHAFLPADHCYATPSDKPQSNRPPIPQPYSRPTQETTEADLFSQNLRIVLDTVTPRGLKEKVSQFRLSPSARIIKPIAKRPNHDMPSPVVQPLSDDDESLIIDTCQEQSSLMVLLNRRKTPFHVPLDQFFSSGIDSSVICNNGYNGLRKPLNVFCDEQRRFIEDIRHFGYPVYKNSPWDKGFYKRLAILGSGLCGDVYSVMKANQKIGPTYALKTLQLARVDEYAQKVYFEDKYILQEIYIMTKMRHKNLMKLKEVFVDRNSVYMVMPLMECSLFNVVSNRPLRALEEQYAVYAFYEVN